MKKINSCIKVEELDKFEHDIFKSEAKDLKGIEKQKHLSNFIDENSKKLRTHFCENICRLYEECEVYENLKNKE